MRPFSMDWQFRTVGDPLPLPRGKAQVGVPDAGTAFHVGAVALLKADAVSVVAFYPAAPNFRAVGAVEGDACAPTTREGGVPFFVAVDREIFDLHAFADLFFRSHRFNSRSF